MPEKRRSYLLVPAGGAGEGMGHLARCIRLGRSLRGRVTFLTSRMDSAACALLGQEIARFSTRPRVIGRVPADSRYDVVVMDTRQTTRGELDSLGTHGPLLCLDEGGEGAAFASFLVDTIPGLPGARGANLASPVFLDLPRRVRASVRKPMQKVLVSFGGEDREGLSDAALAAILRLVPAEATTVVEGPLFGVRAWPPGVRVLRGVSPLSRVLGAYDLVVTHFGITAFEALACGVPVVLLNPTPYHARLGRAAGFATLGTRSPSWRRLRRIFADPARLAAQVDELNARIGTNRGRRLASLVAGLTLRGSSACPVCGRSGNPVIARFPDRTYRRCLRCSTIGLESFAPRAKEYGARYFFSEYKAHYGRTYLEDFSSIQEACRPRVALLRGLLGRDVRGTVVDVGCAYGPFLAALKEAGLPGFGLDVSRGAVAWVRGKLGVPAVCASFETVGRASLPRSVAAVTMWYVIEHFADTALVLRKAVSLLPRGGVLAFSTPNGHGLSGRRSLARFLQNSPGDHFTVFSPRGLGRLLAAYGLELRRVRVTGHHPERFPGLLGRSAARFKAAGAILLMASRLLGLGDTFEAYAVREEN